MRISSSIYSGPLVGGVTGISDFFVVQDKGTLVSMGYILDDIFVERFGITKDRVLT